MYLPEVEPLESVIIDGSGERGHVFQSSPKLSSSHIPLIIASTIPSTRTPAATGRSTSGIDYSRNIPRTDRNYMCDIFSQFGIRPRGRELNTRCMNKLLDTTHDVVAHPSLEDKEYISYRLC